MKPILKHIPVAAGAMAAAPAAYAGSVNTDDPFYTFMTTVDGWLRGGFGVGVALVTIAIGALYGAAKNSPMPTLAGLALAAFIHWGPGIVKNIILAGAVL
jgi:conjugal transfer pilus assembly protein TraA